ncbi:MAG: septum formation inhibitor Maf [Candidatus Kapabacteria bacterium]|nr:septum formation inhibitor Maf [Candidatus Kapabacteria bacterium]
MHLPRPLVLASQSPRRQSLLRHIGFDFEVVVPNIDEDVVPTSMPPDAYVMELALAKARRGAELVERPSIVIGSDTTVVLDDAVLNKPVDAADAIRMLHLLSGRTHTVYTGLALVDSATHRCVSTFRRTQVSFRRLDDDEIKAYVDSGSPLDKAGAYGIQDDFGAVFVRHVDGCYYTIVGLPLELLYTTLRDFAAGAPDA